MGTEISYWLRLNGTFDKREMLLEAISKIFCNGAVAYGREIILIYIFFNDASVNAGKSCFVHLREQQAQFLVVIDK